MKSAQMQLGLGHGDYTHYRIILSEELILAKLFLKHYLQLLLTKIEMDSGHGSRISCGLRRDASMKPVEFHSESYCYFLGIYSSLWMRNLIMNKRSQSTNKRITQESPSEVIIHGVFFFFSSTLSHV